MKTIVIIFTSLITIYATGNIAQATNIDDPTKLEKILQKTIAFPEFAKTEQMEGVVLVSFTVNNDGTLNINLTNESSEVLKDYVVKKLSQIKLKAGNSENGKTYNVKFEFKFEK